MSTNKNDKTTVQKYHELMLFIKQTNDIVIIKKMLMDVIENSNPDVFNQLHEDYIEE